MYSRHLFPALRTIGLGSTSVRFDEKVARVFSILRRRTKITEPFTFRHSSENHTFFMQKSILVSFFLACLSSSPSLRTFLLLFLLSFLPFNTQFNMMILLMSLIGPQQGVLVIISHMIVYRVIRFIFQIHEWTPMWRILLK